MSEHSVVRLLAVIVSLVLCNACSFARIGIVRTLTGETVQGHVRITPERIVVVNAERGMIFGIESSNVARISFPTNFPARATDQDGDEPLPEGWRELDIGSARFPGSTRREQRTFTVRSSGLSIDGDADSCHYVFKPVRGDSEIVAEVTSIQYTHPNAKAGLMMRENLNEYSRNVMMALTAMSGGALQFRENERASTQSIARGGIFAPHWLKLRRRGNDFFAFTSPNGRVWSLFEKMTLAMSENIYVGLAVASAQDMVLNWTTFSNVREAPKLLNDDFTPEVELTSGSIVRGRPQSADQNEIVFTMPRVVRVPTSRVARISLQPLSGELAWKTRVSRPGVWVSNGDFFDGDFRGLDDRKLTISSVLYGLRSFDINDEAFAVVLQARKWQVPQYEIETVDGSVLRASELALGDGELQLKEPALGEVRVPAFEILELRRR